MPNTRIPSPARSQGAGVTPRRHKPRRTLSVGSARSNNSGRLTSIIQQYRNDNMGSFALSPMPTRQSLLTDDTDIDEPRRKSWWKKLNENSRDVMEVLEDNNAVIETNNVVEELIDIEILSQEKKNYTVDLPESSDSESINSIVMPQRKLFNQKESQPQKKFGQLVETRETLAKLHKTNDAGLDDIVNAGTKELFHGNKQRSKPVFPSALLNMSLNKTAADKTKEMATVEPKGQVRNMFGRRPGNKRKNIFADFIVSESEDEVPEIQPKVFGFKKNVNTKACASSVSRGTRDPSPTSSITTDIEMDDWKHLPSSTMVENQLEDIIGSSTPVKRARLSKLSEAKESDAGTNSNKTADRTRQSNKSISSKNKTKLSSNLKEKTLELNEFDSSRNKSKESQNYEENIFAKNHENGDKSQNNYNNRNKSVSNATVSNKSQKSTMEVSRSKMKNIDISQNEKNDYLEKQDKEKISEVVPEIEEDVDVNDDNNFTLEYENDENDPIIETEITPQNDYIMNKDLSIIENVNEIAMHNTNQADIRNNKKNTTPKQDQVKVSVIIEEREKSSVYIKDRSKVIENFKEIKSSKQNNELDNKSNREMNIDREEIISNDKEVDTDYLDQHEGHFEENNKQNVSTNQIEEEMEVDEDNNAGKEADTSEIERENDFVAKEGSQKASNMSTISEVHSGNHVQIEKSEEIDNLCQEIQESEEEHMEDHILENESLEDEQNQSQEVESEIEEQCESLEVDNEIGEESQELENQTEDAEEQNDQEIPNESEQEEQNESLEVHNEMQEEHDESQELEKQSEDEEEQIELDEIHNDIEEERNQIDEDQNEIEEDQNKSQEVENESQEEQTGSEVQISSDEEEQNESHEVQEEGKVIESEEEDKNLDMSQEQSKEEMEHNDLETETPNVSHDTTGRNRNKDQSPEVILHDKTNQIDSFTAHGRNTSVRKTKSIIKNLNIKPSLAPVRESTGLSDGTTNSSAEGSGWDSHRTTRKTLRHTFGKDFTPRKSLRAMVMEKSAKRHTVYNEALTQTAKFPQANNTAVPEDSNHHDVEDIVEESNHEVSLRTRQTTLEAYLQKIKKQNMEERLKMEETVRNSLKINVPVMDILNPFKVPAIPARRNTKTHSKSKSKQIKSSLVTLEDLPPEVIEDLKYKPPKRFRPSNASWITKRLYKFLESKLEPKYDYKARVRAEKLVETLYHFVKDLRRHQVAPSDAVDVLKHEMARLDIVKTHFEFNQFFHDYMPREIRIKVVPDIVNKISLPRHGVFSDILRGNTIPG